MSSRGLLSSQDSFTPGSVPRSVPGSASPLRDSASQRANRHQGRAGAAPALTASDHTLGSSSSLTSSKPPRFSFRVRLKML